MTNYGIGNYVQHRCMLSSLYDAEKLYFFDTQLYIKYSLCIVLVSFEYSFGTVFYYTKKTTGILI